MFLGIVGTGSTVSQQASQGKMASEAGPAPIFEVLGGDYCHDSATRRTPAVQMDVNAALGNPSRTDSEGLLDWFAH